MKGTLDQQNISYGGTTTRTGHLASSLGLHIPAFQEAADDFRKFDRLYDMATGTIRERADISQLDARTCMDIAQSVREITGVV